MINWYDRLKLIFKNMNEKKGRVFLTVSGIIIGIFVFTFFIFVSQGLKSAIANQFTTYGVNVLGILPAGTQGDPSTSPGGLTDNDVEKVKQIAKDAKYIAGLIFHRDLFEYNNEKKVLFIVGHPFLDNPLYETEFQKEMGIDIAEGRQLRTNDRGAIIVGSKVAKEAYSKELRIGEVLKINGKSFRIIGIIKERGDLFIDSSCFMSYDDIKEISGKTTYSIIRVSFPANADLAYYKNAIDTRLNPNGEEKRVIIQSPTDVINQFNQILGLLTAIISFISSVALIVGGINVMNTMYSNVLERINEISVMKAIGATNEDIRNLFLIESSILGFFGAVIGFMLAFILAKVVAYFISYLGYIVPINFDYIFFFEVIFITSLFAMLFGTYPALRAAKINSAENLRDDA